LFLLLPLLGFLVVFVVSSIGISCCFCCFLVVSSDFTWSILGLFLVKYTDFIWLLGLCTQVWCIDLEAQGDQSWLGVRDFIKLKKCKGRGLVDYKDLLLSHILIKYQD